MSGPDDRRADGPGGRRREDSGGEGFLSRWSRRKRGVEVAEPEPAPPPEAIESAPPAAVPEAPPPEAPAPAKAEEPEFDLSALPRIEDLTADSDISAFLRPGVPQALRGAALRRIWSLDPAIRDFIGPADYAWDYNAPGGVPGFSLELGGEVKKLLAQAIGLDEAEAKPQAAGEGDEAPAPDPAPVAAPEPPAEPVLQDTPPLVADAPPAEPPTPERPSPRRRHGGALPS